MLRPLLSALLAALLLCAPAEAQIARRATGYNPGYTFPDLSSGLVELLGDSRIQLANGVTTSSGPTFTVSNDFGLGWGAFPAIASGNILLFGDDYNEGVTGQTSAGVAGRTQIVGNDCNAPGSATTAFCWTGVRIATNLLANSGSTSLQFASTTGVVAGEYLFPNSLTAFAYPTTVNGTPSATVVTLSQATIASIASGQNVSFSTVTKTNPFWTYGGNASSIATTDPDLSLATTGRYSPCTNPAPIVFALFDTNDTSMTSTNTLTNNNYVLDQFGPTLCNKMVVVGNELPRGAATTISELQTIASGSITVTHAATYNDDVAVFYAPAPSGGVPGTNDGVKLTNCNGCGSPSVGQYAVNTSTGVYTFNVGENGLRLQMDYRWKTNAGGTYLNTAHNQLSSSTCGTFVDPVTHTSYPGISGALCNRPWVVPADTWTLALDAGSGSNNYPKAYFAPDGLHPYVGFGRLIAQAMWNAASPYVGAVKKFTAPTVNNVNFAGTSASTTAAQTTTCANIGTNTRNYFLISLTPAASTGVYAIGQKIYAQSTSGVPAGTTIDCVDTTNNQLRLAAPATLGASVSNILAQADITSLFGDGLMDHRSIIVTAVASCNTHCGTPTGLGTTINQGTPQGITFTLGANDTTALNASTFGFNYGIETNPFGDGFDDFVMQPFGVVGTSSMAATLTQTIPTAVAALITPGDKIRGFCKVRVSAGPNGLLRGVNTISITTTLTSTTPFNPPGQSLGTYVNTVARVGGIFSTNQMVEAVDLASGNLIMEELSPPIDTTGMTGISGSIKVVVAADQSAAVSGTVRVGQCWLGKKS